MMEKIVAFVLACLMVLGITAPHAVTTAAEPLPGAIGVTTPGVPFHDVMIRRDRGRRPARGFFAPVRNALFHLRKRLNDARAALAREIEAPLLQ
ncbi:MAG: hypothetical protein LBM74_08675 [Oscillospiraceae bacterium]|jgi:hypothetical protein|nr:hypothetical protein [Oscillospiraceae bacterium]